MPTSDRKSSTTRKRSTTKRPVENVPAVDPQDPYAPSAWGGSAYEDVPLPSGQLCLARKMGVEGLMKAGIIHDIDPLMGMVHMHEARVQGKDDVPSDENMMMDVLKDQQKMNALFHMLDRIVCAIVVKPHVEMTPNDITRRQDGVIYTDMVDLKDKMHLMMWTMGGAESIAGFRDQFEATMGGIPAKPENGDKTE